MPTAAAKQPKGGGIASARSLARSGTGTGGYKRAIRGVERLLAKESLPAEVRKAHEAKLKQLQAEAEKWATAQRESKIAKRYHKVKFFEKRKLVRKLAKLQRDAAPASAVDAVKADLMYVKHFPPGEKYVSLLVGDTPELQARRAHFRQIIAARVAEMKSNKRRHQGDDDGDNDDSLVVRQSTRKNHKGAKVEHPKHQHSSDYHDNDDDVDDDDDAAVLSDEEVGYSDDDDDDGFFDNVDVDEEDVEKRGRSRKHSRAHEADLASGGYSDDDGDLDADDSDSDDFFENDDDDDDDNDIAKRTARARAALLGMPTGGYSDDDDKDEDEDEEDVYNNDGGGGRRRSTTPIRHKLSKHAASAPAPIIRKHTKTRKAPEPAPIKPSPKPEAKKKVEKDWSDPKLRKQNNLPLRTRADGGRKRKRR